MKNQIKREVEHPFMERWERLSGSWKEYFEEVDCIMVKEGIVDYEVIKNKTHAIQYWLFSKAFTNSLMAIGREKIIIFTTIENVEKLREIEKEAEVKGKKIIIIENNGINQDQQIENFIKRLIECNFKKLGIFPKEIQKGKMIIKFEDLLREQKDFQEKACSKKLQLFLRFKDSHDVKLIKKSVQGSCFYMKQSIELIEKIINVDRKISHQDIGKEIEGFLQEQKKILGNRFGINQESFDFSYLPCIQSGNNVDLSPVCENNSETLQNNIIMISLGSKYYNMNSHIVRTLMINPSKIMKNYYQALLYLHESVIKNLEESKKISEIYLESKKQFLQKFPLLENNICNNFGSGQGYEFREGWGVIKEGNEKIIQKNYLFNVTTYLKNLKDEDGLKYSLQIGDSVFIGENGKAENLTIEIPSDFKVISYDMMNVIEDDDLSLEYIKKGKKIRVKRVTYKETNAQKIRQLQRNLLDQLMDRLKLRLKNGLFNRERRIKKKVVIQKLDAYPNNKLPRIVNKNNIHVDNVNFCVLLPVSGLMVPFHVACIKNVTINKQRNCGMIRFNFQVPLLSTGDIIFPVPAVFGTHPIYIKELVYKTVHLEGMRNVIKNIQDLQKKFTLQKDISMEDRIEIDSSDLGQPLKDLENLKMRPTLGGRKTFGRLTVCEKGFQFQTRKNYVFKLHKFNIKTAIFQPCQEDMIVIIHLLLKQKLIINKKLTSHIQFYADVGYTSEDLNDPRKKFKNEINFEEEAVRESEARKNYNKLFGNFVDFVEQAWAPNFKFDKPFKNLKFLGSPFQNNVYIMPCEKSLVSIQNMPFMVINLNEIELISIERVDNKIKNFDLIIIFKDYTKQTQTISNIPKVYLEMIKIWLTQEQLVFFEGGTTNLKWDRFLKKIVEDPEKFILEEGGWYAFADYSEEEDQEDDPDFNENDFYQQEQESESEEFHEDGFDEDYYSHSEDSFEPKKSVGFKNIRTSKKELQILK